MRTDYRIIFVNDQSRLAVLAECPATAPALALEIETSGWWDPSREWVSLIQLAYRSGPELRVAVVYALAPLHPALLRRPLELGGAIKAVHNAAFDAARLSRHFKVEVAPINDAMLAARRGGERRYSLKAQPRRTWGYDSTRVSSAATGALGPWSRNRSITWPAMPRALCSFTSTSRRAA